MRQLVVALMVVALMAVTGTLSSTLASAASLHRAHVSRSPDSRAVSARSAAAASNDPTSQAALAQQIIATAERYIGYKYSWTGSTPETGFSCVGLVYWVYNHEHTVPVGRNLEEAYAMAPHVSRADLQPADLIFFSGTVQGMTPLSHVAIYVGNGKMIAADSFATGVEWDNLSDSWWADNYVGAARPLAASGIASSPAQQPASPGQSATPPVTATAALPDSSGAMTVTADTAPHATIPATASSGTALVVKDATVAVRSGAGDGYMQIGTAHAGSTMIVVGSLDSWYHVTYADEQFGWVPAYAVLARQAVAMSVPTVAAVATAMPAPAKPLSSTVVAGTGAYIGHVNDRMVVSVQKLKVHAAPGLTTHTIGQLDFGSVVVVLRVQRDWNMVALSSGNSGWVYSHYLSSDLALAAKTHGGSGKPGAISAPPGQPTTKVAGFKQTSAYRVVVVAADVLIVRAAPSTKAAIAAQAHKGDRLRVLRSQARWLYVMIRGGRTGWVSAQWVE